MCDLLSSSAPSASSSSVQSIRDTTPFCNGASGLKHVDKHCHCDFFKLKLYYTLVRCSFPPEPLVQMMRCLEKRKHCRSPSFFREREPSRPLVIFPFSLIGTWISDPVEQITEFSYRSELLISVLNILTYNNKITIV